ncbi:MAG: hypothetical protein Kow0092_11620 [Deferrisomatales bacterium]
MAASVSPHRNASRREPAAELPAPAWARLRLEPQRTEPLPGAPGEVRAWAQLAPGVWVWARLRPEALS